MREGEIGNDSCYGVSTALRQHDAFGQNLKISARDEQGRWASRGGGSRGVGAEEARAQRVAVATGPDLMREEHAQTSMTARTRLRQNGWWGICGRLKGIVCSVSWNSYIQAKSRESDKIRPLNPSNNQGHLAKDPLATKEVVI